MFDKYLFDQFLFDEIGPIGVFAGSINLESANQEKTLAGSIRLEYAKEDTLAGIINLIRSTPFRTQLLIKLSIRALVIKERMKSLFTEILEK